MRDITHIVIHCSATIEGRDHDVKEIDRWHKARGFARIGYHYVIKLDGTRQHGRTEIEVGAHAEGCNAKSIGVCYVGGLGANAKSKDTRTAAQKAALLKLLKELRARYPKAVILGHRDLSPDKDGDGVIEAHEWMKACPSFDARAEYAGI